MAKKIKMWQRVVLGLSFLFGIFASAGWAVVLAIMGDFD